MAPTIATATAGGAAWCAFVLFGKRRRDGDDEPQSDSLLAAAAGSGVDTGAAPGLRVVDESQMPRWRRPSLQQVRRTDPLRAVVEAPHMSFAAGGARDRENYERRVIRYRLVRLLDCPDEVRAAEIGVLDRGDEVQLMERHGVYWRVGCPDGRTGWVHRMTLGDPAAPEAPAPAAPEAAPSAVEYEAPFLALLESSAEAMQEIAPGNEVAAVAPPDAGGDGFLEAYMRARSELHRQDAPAEASVEPAAVETAAVETAAVETAAVGPAPAEAVAVERAAPVKSRRAAPVKSRRAAPGPAPVEAVAVAPAAPVKSRRAALARDYLERAGFAVKGPETAAAEAATEAPTVETAAAETAAASPPADQPSGAVSEPSPAAEPVRADGKYSARKSGGSRKASTASRPGTKSRRPSR